MAKISIFNIGKANEALDAAHAEIDPALQAANITSIKVNGKDVPASEAPLAEKIKAVMAANPVGAASQNVEEIIGSNNVIAARAEKAESDLVASEAKVTSLTRDNVRLTSANATLKASVETLTAQNSELVLLKDAAVKEAGRVTKENSAINSQISKMCIEVGCLELVDENGKALKADADEATKIAAADKISVSDKLKAFKGAVNSAIAKTGVNISTLPAAPASGAGATEKAQGPELTGVERAMAAHKAKLEAGKK